MKKLFAVLVVLFGVALMGANCNNTSGGGDGFDLTGGPLLPTSWDLLLLRENGACPKSFPASGPGISGLLGGGVGLPTIGLFQGVAMSASATEFAGVIPEVYMIGYAQMADAVQAGDAVTVHFIYQANADGANGDYFLTRILDGDMIRVAAAAYDTGMTANEPVTVDYAYTATDAGFGLEFMIGLSSPMNGLVPADMLYLDDLVVTVNGIQLFADDFESWDPLNMTVFPPAIGRLPVAPTDYQGSIGLSNQVLLKSGQALRAVGGRYFDVSGDAINEEGYNAAIIDFADPDTLVNPFYGQVAGITEQGVIMGTYKGWNDFAACEESGQAMIASNVGISADLSGFWVLHVEALCEEGAIINDTITTDSNADPLAVSRMLTVFVGPSFEINNAGTIASMFGLTLGNSATFILVSPMGDMAQVIGGYDPSTGMFVGELSGTLPQGAGVCTIDNGFFSAMIDSSTFISP